jgi:putative transposase
MGLAVRKMSREILATEVGQRLTGDDIARVLEHMTADRGKRRRSIQVDNRLELISRSSDMWPYFNRMRLDISRPGKLTDKA